MEMGWSHDTGMRQMDQKDYSVVSQGGRQEEER